MRVVNAVILSYLEGTSVFDDSSQRRKGEKASSSVSDKGSQQRKGAKRSPSVFDNSSQPQKEEKAGFFRVQKISRMKTFEIE